jgi:F5/8 type C domain/Carbohydrate binding domain/Glycosyl hydrolases family 18
MTHSSIRLPTAALAAVLLAATFIATASTPAPVGAASGAYGVAPYVDMTGASETLLDQATTIGLHYYTAAFVLGEGCSQIWATTYPIGADPVIDPEISRARSEGATPIISYGGSAGIPLAWSCTNQTSIVTGYQQVINTYGVTWLDFDVEGAAIADSAAGTRNALAMKSIKAGNPNIKFSMTMPVLPTGLTQDGINQLTAAKNAGVKIDLVNIMTMDFYQGTGTEMGQASIAAAQATLAQMKAVDSSYTYANLGITPMIGVNDDHSTFTLADAASVTSWANSNGVARLAFWSIGRDQGGCNGSVSPSCSGVSQNALDFTRAFMAGGPSPTPPPATATPTQNPGVNRALGRPATASSTESASYPASSAVDGSTSTRWSSAFSDPQWLQVDLGSSYAVNRVRLNWETAYASAYQIQVSADASNWTTIYSTTTGTGGLNDLTVSGTGRYVRMYGTTRATQWGYSLWEFEVYGNPVVGPTPTPTRTAGPTATPAPTGSPTATPVVTPPPGGGVVNPGFETGSLAPWTGAGDSVVTGQAHTGTYALLVNATNSSTGQAQQLIGVSASHAYTLSCWVKGNYAYVGVTGTGTSDGSTWTSSAGYTQLRVPFTTGASTTSVTIWVHGWYGQGAVYADDCAVQ